MNVLENNKNVSPEEFYKNFKEKLTEMYQFPTEYLFKFIIPNDQEKQAEIFRVFDGLKHTITERDSKNGKYTAVNVNTAVADAGQIVDIYQEVAKIKDVIML